MDIDMTALRSLERERDISLDVLVSAIEHALLSAYHRTPDAQERARVELDRKTGHVTVWAAELDDDGAVVREWDDTPGGLRADRDRDRSSGHRPAAARRGGRS